MCHCKGLRKFDKGMNGLKERFEKIREIGKQMGEEAINNSMVEDIKVSYKVFKNNFEELLRFSEEFTNRVESKNGDMNNNDFSSELSMEALRLLNNYVLSSKALKDHTKVFMNSHYKDCEFYVEHDVKIKEIYGKSQLLHFVQELRNYTFNRELPLVAVGIKQNNNENMINTLCLDIETLRKWSGWTSATKAFIDSLESKVELNKFVNQYWIEVDGFYQWFYHKLNEVVFMRCS